MVLNDDVDRIVEQLVGKDGELLPALLSPILEAAQSADVRPSQEVVGGVLAALADMAIVAPLKVVFRTR